MYTDTEGIVLSQINITGGRRMIHIFTQKYGKISAGSAQYERKSKSKSALAVRPFTYGRYELFKNRDSYELNSGEVIKSFFAISEDLDKYINTAFVLELTSKVLPEEYPQPRLFSILIDFMKLMEKRATAFDTPVLAYMVKLLEETGTAPELSACASCGSENPEFFSIEDGGMICGDCLKNKNRRLIYKPEFDIINIIRYFSVKPIVAFEKVALNDKDAKQLRAILREYLKCHLDVGPLKSESML